MIFHTSISANNPENVARVIAEVWRGGVMKAPPDIFEVSYMAFGRDERGSMIEVHPADFAFVLRTRSNEVPERDPAHAQRMGFSPVHFAIGTPRSEAEVHAIAKREGWECQTCWRGVPGGGYGVVEFWVENRFMLEVLTPEMQEQYRTSLGRIPKILPEYSPSELKR